MTNSLLSLEFRDALSIGACGDEWWWNVVSW
eukprot:CAMPEP_0194141328 /NCGR_PEP_ID=MMETSP0152-20130528/10744_1 /TAXON_ID=1049557 /ORGANISM="Thalassiothrix antarctica, Strain L6-D1" /LENGTH=30 /DNA_ID= /DNA_START= /DNA_END= /DNA_ORIENTATION=